jgi:hypothetical protein
MKTNLIKHVSFAAHWYQLVISLNRENGVVGEQYKHDISTKISSGMEQVKHSTVIKMKL